MNISGETLFFGAIAAIILLFWISSSIRHANYRRMMEHGQMGMGMGMGFGMGRPLMGMGQPMVGMGYGHPGFYRSRMTGGLTVVLFLIFGTIIALTQLKKNYTAQESPQTNLNTPDTQRGSSHAYDYSQKEEIRYPKNTFGAGKREGTYVQEAPKTEVSEYDVSTRADETREEILPVYEAANEVFIGFGKQLQVLSDHRSALATMYQLERRFPDTPIFIALELKENNQPLFKIVAGNFLNKASAEAALPSLKSEFPDSYGVDLNELNLLDI